MLALLSWIVLSPPGAQPLGCASFGGQFEGRRGQTLQHKKLGYTIDWPGVGDREVRAASWRRFRMERPADLAFRHQSSKGVFLMLLRECRSSLPDPQLAARSLRIGFRPAVLLYSSPLSILGHAGWAQAFRTSVGDRRATVSAITLSVGRCTFDWVLVTPEIDAGDGEATGDALGLSDVFESWWSSFELDEQRQQEIYPIEQEGP